MLSTVKGMRLVVSAKRIRAMARLKVREIAEAKGYNIASLSRRADVSLKTIRRLWRNPESVTTTDTLERIAKALEVTIADLFEV